MSKPAAIWVVALLATSTSLTAFAGSKDSRDPKNWEIHDKNRPMAPVVEPGPYQGPTPAPSDAIVLFDGSNFDHWNHSKWKITDDKAMKVVPKAGDLLTKKHFGDCQLHIEWSADPDSPGSAQHRSNSGVFFMGTYEVQILDTYKNENKTYADGQAGSIYGQYPPLVNPGRPAGQWNVYDIVFRRPHFNDKGECTQPARITVFFNGVLVQDNEPLVGPTSHKKRAPYKKHGDKGPLRLQDHKDDPIRFRNVWIRELE